MAVCRCQSPPPFFLMWTIFKVFMEFVTVLFLFYVLVIWPWGIWDLSFLTRGQTLTPCIGRWSLNHWTAGKPPACAFQNSSELGPLILVLCSCWSLLRPNRPAITLMPLSAALINPLLYVCRLMFSLQRDLRWWGSATLSYRAFRQPNAPSSCVSKDVLFVFSADGPNQRVCPDVFWGDPSTEGAGEMMHTPAAYKGEHPSRSVSFDAQEMGASAFTCLLRLQCHPRVPEKSGADVPCLGKSALLFREERGGVVWAERASPTGPEQEENRRGSRDRVEIVVHHSSEVL